MADNNTSADFNARNQNVEDERTMMRILRAVRGSMRRDDDEIFSDLFDHILGNNCKPEEICELFMTQTFVQAPHTEKYSLFLCLRNLITIDPDTNFFDEFITRPVNRLGNIRIIPLYDLDTYEDEDVKPVLIDFSDGTVMYMELNDEHSFHADMPPEEQPKFRLKHTLEDGVPYYTEWVYQQCPVFIIEFVTQFAARHDLNTEQLSVCNRFLDLCIHNTSQQLTFFETPCFLRSATQAPLIP